MSAFSGRRNESFLRTTPSSRNGSSSNNVEAMQQQIDLYAELAAELEETILKRDAEIRSLKETNQELQNQCQKQTSRISNLETQCVARSAKVAQLSDTIAAKQTDKVQERLIEKSLEIAELTEQNERLRLQRKNLQEEKSKNGKLLLEMSDIVRQLNQIQVRYNKSSSNRNNKNNNNDSSLVPLKNNPQDGPLENVRRKIKAIEEALHERDALLRETKTQKGGMQSLKTEVADLNFQIASLEAALREKHENHHRPPQRTSSESDYTFESCSDGSKEVSYEEFVVESGRSFSGDRSEDSSDPPQRDPRFTRVDQALSPVEEVDSKHELDSKMDDENDTRSFASSFDSIEPPPSPRERVRRPTSKTIDPEEYKELQRNFDKALDVIERLKQDLSKEREGPSTTHLSRTMKLEDALAEIERLEDQLQRAKADYKVLQDGFRVLRDHHEEAKIKHANLEKTYNESQRTSEQALEEVSTMNTALKKQYNDLEKEYSCKIEGLEQELNVSKRHLEMHQLQGDFENQSATIASLEKELKKSQEDQEAMETIHKDRINEIVNDHTAIIEGLHKKHKDLQYEYDTFLEIHLKLEEEILEAKNHYKESLLKIRTMESEARDAAEATEKLQTDHRERIETIEAQHKEALDEKDTHLAEWKEKFARIQKEYHLATEEHEKLQKKYTEDIEELKKVHKLAMGKMGKLRQNDATKYQKLRRDFDAALVNHGKKEQITIHKFEQAKEQYESRMREYERKVDEFEELLAMSKHGTPKEPDEGHSEMLYETIHRLEGDLQEASIRFQTESQAHKRLTSAYETLKEQHDSLQANKNAEQLRIELLESKQRLEREAQSNENLRQAILASKEKCNRILHQNQALQGRVKAHDQELKDCHENQEHVKTIYHELTASYQASLLMIESLLQQREESSTWKQRSATTNSTVEESNEDQSTVVDDSENDSESCKGSTVMARIKALEQRSETVASKTKAQRKTLFQPKMDSLFQRDFDMIAARIGIRSSQDSVSESSAVDTVLSSWGSVSANSEERRAIFEAIYNRVDEHAQKMEAIQSAPVGKGSQEEETPWRSLQRIDDLFDILYHFVQWRSVNASFLALPQFSTMTASEESPKGKDDHQVPSLTQEATEIQKTDKTDLPPDEQKTNEKSSSELQSNEPIHREETTKKVGNPPTIPEEGKIVDTEDSPDETKKNTEPRDKEIRLLDLKYQTLKEEFQELKAVRPPVNIEVPYSTTDEDTNFCCEQSLAMSSVTGFHPSDTLPKRVDSTQHVQEFGNEGTEIEDEIQSTLSRLEELDEFENVTLLDDGHSIPTIGHPTRINDASNDAVSGDATNLSPLLPDQEIQEDAQTLGEASMAVSISNESSERRDEKTVRNSVDSSSEEGAKAAAARPNPNRNDARNMRDIEMELKQAKRAAEIARRKQMEREDNLRDVIFQYKELQKEHKALLEAETSKPGDNEKAMVNELNQAKANIQSIQGELKRATEQHSQEKHHLQTVMNQYRALQADFMKILNEKQQLEMVVYHRPGMGSQPPGFVKKPPGNNNNNPIPHPSNGGSPPPRAMRAPGNSKRIGPDGMVHGTGNHPHPHHRVGPPRMSPQHPMQSPSHQILGQSLKIMEQSRAHPTKVPIPQQKIGKRRPIPAKPGAPLKSSFRKESSHNAAPIKSLQFSPKQQQELVSLQQQQQQQQQRLPQQRMHAQQQPKPTMMARTQGPQLIRKQTGNPQPLQSPAPTQRQQESPMSPTTPTSRKKAGGLFRGLSFNGNRKQSQPKDQPGIARSFRL